MNPRTAVMVARYKSGETLEQIAADYGITRERVRQILSAQGLDRSSGGRAVRAEQRRARYAEVLEANCMSKHGMSRADFKQAAKTSAKSGATYAVDAISCFRQQRNSAKHRGMAWNLTFAEWWKLWQDSGKWNERGLGGYCLAAIDPGFGFYVGNVEIIKHGELARQMRVCEKAEGRGAFSPEVIARRTRSAAYTRESDWLLKAIARVTRHEAEKCEE